MQLVSASIDMPSNDSAKQIDRVRRLFILQCLLGISAFFIASILILLFVVAGGISASTSHLMYSLMGALFGVAMAWSVSLGGHLEIASHLYFATLCVVMLIVGLPTGLSSSAIFVVTLPMIAAPMFLRAFWSFPYAIAGAVVMFTTHIIHSDQANYMFMLIDIALWTCFFIIVSLLSFLSARVYERQLTLSDEKNQALIKTQAELEERVAERTRDIQQAMDELRIQTETIRLLNVPILPVADNVLALPLVGTLDSQRMQSITEQLLDAINREKARFVLIDITGVPVVDSYVAGALLRTAQAVRLLGAEPILVGMKGEVAQMLVGLGANLSDIISLRDIRTGITYTRGLVEQQSSSRNNLSSYIN